MRKIWDIMCYFHNLASMKTIWILWRHLKNFTVLDKDLIWIWQVESGLPANVPTLKELATHSGEYIVEWDKKTLEDSWGSLFWQLFLPGIIWETGAVINWRLRPTRWQTMMQSKTSLYCKCWKLRTRGLRPHCWLSSGHNSVQILNNKTLVLTDASQGAHEQETSWTWSDMHVCISAIWSRNIKRLMYNHQEQHPPWNCDVLNLNKSFTRLEIFSQNFWGYTAKLLNFKGYLATEAKNHNHHH